MRWRRSPREVDQRVIHQVAAWCLTYPDEGLLAKVELLQAALAEHPDRTTAAPLQRFADHLADCDAEALRREYVDVFDLSRKQTLYLSYWTEGDTRRRGAVLGEFKQLYRDSGYLVDLRGELPDFLPVVLEYCARANPAAGLELLTKYRPALELIRFGLIDLGTPYANVLTAICTGLPGASPSDRRSALDMQSSIPTETVGLEPFDPRLLPIAGTR
ncbi:MULTISPECIES: nitrate reductase molybdenum cofactor assembly chaperone [unclassified Rhodococcus (in: high G+C Gram-positive bacteria)]|uniref:nitrate reductase molybdenum cofactor assembly chaperone n=1 Tax=unclassified Rhodococcus (in: high G+C Gram-positive bacteria) TaxID=192944 RepID=UPI0005B51F20|nr:MULTISPECIES: nitrate reductase molybdenum cofactor assembly chaperone [unclassified Rhodococcus (in: high G+C Gram-positive bacteria)]